MRLRNSEHEPMDRKLIKLGDLKVAIRWLPAVVIAGLLPSRWWPLPARAYAAATTWTPRWRRRRDELGSLLNRHRPDLPAKNWSRAYAAHVFMRELSTMRMYLRPRWRPVTRVTGAEHIEQALAAGRGAILWVTPLVYSDLITKVALAEAGFSVHHLSRYSHPYSDTLVGEHLINPVPQRIERRFLASRLVIPPGGMVAVLRQLTKSLRRGELVSITVGQRGRNTVRRPFLDGHISVASGAPDLARRTGAPLLPVFTARQSDGSFDTIVESPLVPDTEATADAEMDRLVVAWVPLYEKHVFEHPDQLRWS